MENENMQDVEVIAAAFNEHRLKLAEVVEQMITSDANPPVLAFALGFGMAELAATFMSFHQYETDQAFANFDTMLTDVRAAFAEMFKVATVEMEKAEA